VFEEANKFPGTLELNDLNSRILNGARLRQIRVKEKKECMVSSSIKKYFNKTCSDTYDSENEEKQSFGPRWRNATYHKNITNPLDKPWQYQTVSDLDTFMVNAEMGDYLGGGYVAELFPKWNNSVTLKELRNELWLDQLTCVVMLELTTYNAGTMHLSSVEVIFEFPPMGGMLLRYNIDTYRAFEEMDYTTILCHVLFVLVTLLFTVRELRSLYQQKINYFLSFWNKVEVVTVSFSYCAIVVCFYREELLKDLASRVDMKSPENYISFQQAMKVDSLFIFFLSSICFCTTLKFIKLLRFNKRFTVLSETVLEAVMPLKMFGITFILCFTASVCVATLFFRNELYTYRNVWVSVASCMRLVLGKFSYRNYENADRRFGPIFFLYFNVIINFILLNMTVSILDDSYHRVHARLRHLPNEYEVMDYVVRALKGLFGMKTHPRLKSAESVAAKEVNANDPGNQETSSVFTQVQNLKNVTKFIQLHKRDRLQGREKLKVDFKKHGSKSPKKMKSIESTLSRLNKAVDRIIMY
jgi:hypothetical protein